MARKRSKSKRRSKRRSEQSGVRASRASSNASGGFSEAASVTPSNGVVPENEPRRSTFTVIPGSPRSRYSDVQLSNDSGKGVEGGLALRRNRHSLLPQDFELKRVEHWLDKGNEEQFEWAFRYLQKSFLGFPIPDESTSNREIVFYWFSLPDVSGAAKTKLFSRMTNAWYQRTKRAKRKSAGVRSVELSSRRMKELKLMASDAEITVMQALDEIVKVAYENKKQFRRQSEKVKKAAIEKMKLEIRGADG